MFAIEGAIPGNYTVREKLGLRQGRDPSKIIGYTSGFSLMLPGTRAPTGAGGYASVVRA